MDTSIFQMDGMCWLYGREWKCSAECDIIVNSTVHILRYEKYILACLKVFIDTVQQVWNFKHQQPNTIYDVTADRNGIINPRCRSTWRGTVAALPLIMRNCTYLSAMSVTRNESWNRYISLCDRRGTLSWHRLYTVRFVQCNGDTRLHC